MLVLKRKVYSGLFSKILNKFGSSNTKTAGIQSQPNTKVTLPIQKTSEIPTDKLAGTTPFNVTQSKPNFRGKSPLAGVGPGVGGYWTDSAPRKFGSPYCFKVDASGATKEELRGVPKGCLGGWKPY